MPETELWVVEKDGRVIQRGFQSETLARRFVENFVDSLERHTAGSTVRVPDFDVKRDRQFEQDNDRLYTEHKTHTQVVM